MSQQLERGYCNSCNMMRYNVSGPNFKGICQSCQQKKEQTSTQTETMTVTIYSRNDWNGTRTVTISTFCSCGQRRGTPFLTVYWKDERCYQVHKWENPCGHVETYKDVLNEAAQLAAKEQ